jgi:hypothetical protein
MKKIKWIFLVCCLVIQQAYAQGFYDRSTVQTIEVFFASATWDSQLDNLAATTEDYLLADSVRINGVTFDSVGVKYKGNSSYNPSNNKNPLHIKLDWVKGNADYDGYTSVKLQNGYQDPSMIREVLSYAILEQYMDCPQANFANVYINGTLRGLYSNAQSIDDKFNSDHYYSADGSFFKCNPVGGAGPGSSASPDLKYLGADSSLYFSSYQLESNYGWNDLRNLTDTLNNQFAQIEEVLDVDRALWMLAFNNVLVNLDSYSGAFRQNYYLYNDLNDRFVPTVWDLNMSFAGFPGGSGSSSATTNLDPLNNSTSSIHPLIVKLFGDARYKRMYLAHLRTIVQEIFASGNYLTTANAIRTTIDASVQADPYKFYTYTQYQNSLTTGVTGGGGPGGGTTTPGIQALMDARVTFFNSNSNYLLVAPTLVGYASSNTSPSYGETITITANCSNENAVFLGYRYSHELKFTKITMLDDGAHNDGAAGDHVYGAFVTMNCADLEYYIYLENANAGLFSPQRAEHEFHHLTVTVVAPAVDQVVINELLASNGSIVLDAYGENDDWMELYNTTNMAIDLSGLYLTDDALNLMQFQLPIGTIIAPHAVMVIWTDDDADQTTGIHTNFKLSAAGETLILSDGTTILNQVTYPIQTTDISYARCPDAGTFTFATPTYNALNNCSLSITEMVDPMEISIYPVPAHSVLHVVSNESTDVRIAVIDLQGRVLFTGIIQPGSIDLPIENWNNGYYTMQLMNAMGNQKTLPFIKE